MAAFVCVCVNKPSEENVETFQLLGSNSDGSCPTEINWKEYMAVWVIAGGPVLLSSDVLHALGFNWAIYVSKQERVDDWKETGARL